MQFLTSSKVNEIIQLANNYYGNESRSEIIGSKELGDAVTKELSNPARHALYEAIKSLTPQEKAELEALMLIGRGYDGDDMDAWGTMYEAALMHKDLVHYVASKKYLAKYLENGLATVNAATAS
ncbi:DUF3775 domain-containing protein [Photobacterium leiognathi]|uniref:DUF3775 domain-containing protein n=1 Tax=Photobacterium leiognathi TaxID=553611 RepID=UPI0029813693|nr:DUF3775 domain-containing protein [Photobacterium leiognathi]